MRSAACHLLAQVGRGGGNHSRGLISFPALHAVTTGNFQWYFSAGQALSANERSFTSDAKDVRKTPSAKPQLPTTSTSHDSATNAAKKQSKLTSIMHASKIDQQQVHSTKEEIQRPWHSGLDVAQLASVPLNMYFDAPLAACSESTKQYYADPALADEQVNQPNYGCKAVQAEMQCFGTNSLLQRQCTIGLQQTIAEQQKRHVYLDGWTGSGKSIALFIMVNWARKNGWIVMYIPSAYLLVEGSSYVKGEDELWETPDAARFILNSMKDNHLNSLEKLSGRNGKPLATIITEGLAAREPKDVVDAAIALKEELQALKDVPVLIAVDDYNVLYSHTQYFEAMHAFHHRSLAPEEIRLVRAFRVMEQPSPANGVSIAAPTFGNTISDKLRIPLPKGSRFHVPRYALDEVRATVEYFSAVGHIKGTPDIDTLKRAMFLTNGNAKELREYAPTLLHDDGVLGLSLGYKAMANRMKKYMETV